MNKQKYAIELHLDNEELAALSMVLAQHLVQCEFKGPLVDLQKQLVSIAKSVHDFSNEKEAKD